MSRDPSTITPTKESDSQRPGIEMFNLLGRQELRQQRNAVVGITVVTVQGLCLLGTLFLIGILNESVRDAEKEKIIFAYPTSDGVFIPSKVMPDEHINAMVKDYLFNRENYTPESVGSNLRYAKRLMTPDYAIQMQDTLERVRRLSRQSGITQVMGFTSPINITKKSYGFDVSFTAVRVREAGGKIYSREKMEVAYQLIRVRPSRHYNWGLMVGDRPVMRTTKKIL